MLEESNSKLVGRLPDISSLAFVAGNEIYSIFGVAVQSVLDIEFLFRGGKADFGCSLDPWTDTTSVGQAFLRTA